MGFLISFPMHLIWLFINYPTHLESSKYDFVCESYELNKFSGMIVISIFWNLSHFFMNLARGVLRADSFDFEPLKSARHLAHFFPLEAKLSQPNPHTHSRKRENNWEKKWKLILLMLSLLSSNEHPWPLFIGKGLYKNSLDLKASRISRISHTFMPKYLPPESSMEYSSLHDIYNIVLEYSRTP